MKSKQAALRFFEKDTAEDVATLIPDWLCPACYTGRNSQGGPLLGSRAVALHIAGKIRLRDSVHRDWALRRVGEAIYDPYVKRTINTLADALKPTVIEDNRIRRELAYQKVTSLIEEERTAGDPAVDAYRHVRELETTLHQFVRDVLVDSLGEDEQDWWVKGVPTQIRAECAMRREEDPAREDVYRYTYLLDLRTIVDKNWAMFEHHLQSARPHLKSKGDFLKSIARLNDLRNRVAHPIRMSVSDEDLSFLRSFCDVVRNFTRGK